MKKFRELYDELLKNSLNNKEADYSDYDTTHLNCLLYPEKHPLVWRLDDCECEAEHAECIKACPFDAIKPGDSGNVEIVKELCTGCSACIDSCKANKLTASKDIIPALKAVRSSGDNLAYALIAPAFLGQFSNDVTPGKLRNALKEVGFDGMIEVALFADILTLKEALEFDANIMNEEDFQLTSCCCPIWISMIRKIYHDLMPHVPASVSPMIACARTVKLLHPNAITVFIGPCIAKKAEAKEEDLKGDVDFVLTFQEIKDIFDATGIDPLKMEDSEREHSSRAGRIYAYAGGVSEAVQMSLEKISPNRKIPIKTRRADGVSDCKVMINDLLSGNGNANFFEGMGCKGGCVGGPKSIIPAEEGKKNVSNYGSEAVFLTPIENPYVIELLEKLGFDTIESLLKDSKIFTRHF